MWHECDWNFLQPWETLVAKNIVQIKATTLLTLQKLMTLVFAQTQTFKSSWWYTENYCHKNHLQNASELISWGNIQLYNDSLW